jgi:hypothetical protein
LSRIARLFFATTFNSHFLISIAIHYAFTITYTFVDCYISTYSYIDSCISASMTFSSPSSFYIVCSSTKCYSTTSSSFNFSMNIGSTDVAPSLVWAFLHTNFYFCTKLNYRCSNSIYIMNYYLHKLHPLIICFPSAHSKDDDECGNDLITNGWIFNKPSCFVLFNSSSSYILFNNFVSSSCLCLCSLLCTSFSFIIHFFFLHSLHSCCYELQNFENTHNF